MKKTTKRGAVQPPAPTRYRNLDDVEVGGPRRGYVKAGRILARIDGCRYTDGYKGETYRADMTVLKVLQDGFANPVTGVALAPNRVGEEVAEFWQPQRTKGADVFLKQFLLTAYDATAEEFAEQGGSAVVMPMTFGEEQALAGAVVEILAEPVAPRDDADRARAANAPFTPSRFIRRVPLAELREHLDEDAIARFFPDFEEAIAAERAEG